MAEQTLPADRPSESICPWCSAALVADSATCASCGASLESEEDRDLPGLTAVDTTILRNEKKPPSRSRLLSWISGEYPDDTPSVSEAQAQAKALAPPDPAVQREINRLALEAEIANLQAEADSLLSEAVVEGRVAELPEDIQPLATGEFDADTLAAATADGAVPAAPADGSLVGASEVASDEAEADDEARPA